MVSEKTNTIVLLTTLQLRVQVRFQTYARQYELFRRYPLCEDEEDRRLQLNIAYLYHTSLSILEERRASIAEYIEDAKGVMSSLDEDEEAEDERSQILYNLDTESEEQVTELARELEQIDLGIKTARRQERRLLAE